MRLRVLLTQFASALALLSAATAQVEDVAAGIGRLTITPLPLDRIVGRAACNGITWLNGLAYVSARGDRASSFNPNSVFVIDVFAGQLVGEGRQRTVAPGPSDFRDADNDGVSLMFGSSQGIWVCDPGTIQAGAEIGLSSVVIAANGPQVLGAYPIVGPGLAALGSYSGVAFDPNGNGGNGSIWTGAVLSDLLEIDLAGNILRRFPNPGPWTRGLALDPQTGSLWINSFQSSFAFLIEVDPATGLATGRQILRDRTFTVDPGGLDLVPGGLDGRGCGNDLLDLDRGSTDRIVGYRLNLWDRFTHPGEPVLTLGVNGGARRTGSVQVPAATLTLEWSVSNPAPSALVINVPPRSNRLRPVGPVAPGFRSLWELRRDLATAVVFGGIGNTTVSLPAPALASGTRLALQAVQLQPGVVDPGCGLRFGLATSNDAAFDFVR